MKITKTTPQDQTKKFLKKYPKVKKAIELFDLSYGQYKSAVSKKMKITASDKTQFKSFYVN